MSSHGFPTMAFITELLKAVFLITSMAAAAYLLILAATIPGAKGTIILAVGVWILILNGLISVTIIAHKLGWP